MTVRDFTIVADEPPHVGGSDAGPTPTELLLASLASCFTMALAYAARRAELELPTDLAVNVSGHHRGPRFDRVEVAVRTAEPSDALASLLDTAATYCYVSNTLSHPPEMSYYLQAADQADR